MIKFPLLLLLALASFIAGAQNTGTVLYSRTMQMQISIADNEALQQAMPRSRTDKFELKFAATNGGTGTE
jgi:hypothetical protein